MKRLTSRPKTIKRLIRRNAALQFCLAVILVISVNAQQPNNNDEQIAVNLLKEDFSYLRNKLESTQPGLYLYTSKDSLDKVFDGISTSLNEPMTSQEFYKRIAPLNKVLRNLHTRFWASGAYETSKETGLPRFPFDIYWDNGQMYILRNNSTNENIVPGSVVLRINGENSTTVFQKLLDCTMRDGFNDSYPIAYASRNFGSYYAQLIGTPNIFSVELITPDGSEQKIELQGVTAAEISNSRVRKYNRRYSQHGEDWEAWRTENVPALRFEMKEDIAIMTLRTFHTYTIEWKGQKYEEFFIESFNQLAAKKITDLVIDLRNNHGGHDLVGMALMSHLHDSAFYYYKRRTALIKPNGKSIKKGNIYEIVGRGGWTGKVTPAQQIFKGNVFVLMNGYSVSAAGEFIGQLKNINRAVFIGEEAGGNPVIFTGGQSLSIDLPHTHITGVLPLHLNEMNVNFKNTGHGVIPNYKIRPQINDILAEKDVEMDFVFKLINGQTEP